MKLVRGKGDDNRDSNKLTCLFHLHLKTGSKGNSRENNELIFVFFFFLMTPGHRINSSRIYLEFTSPNHYKMNQKYIRLYFKYM